MSWIVKNYDPSWHDCFKTVHYVIDEIDNRIDRISDNTTIFPPQEMVFRAFQDVTPENVKVVILGQDPYHGENQAMGLSFSVPEGCKVPPSLKNIYKERESDCGIPASDNGDLTKWVKQGVLLLNATLTVSAHEPNSHKDFGWQEVTDEVISWLSDRERPLVFVLWGAFAKRKSVLIDSSRHTIITSPHPSPFSSHKGFFGSKPFSKINDALRQYNYEPIDWANV